MYTERPQHRANDGSMLFFCLLAWRTIMRRKLGSISKNCMAAIMSASIMMSSVVAFPMTAMAGPYYLENGSITIHATTEGQSVTQGSNVTPNDPTPVIHNDDPSNNVQCDQTSNTITIEADSGTIANVTLQDVNIDTGNNGGAAVTVTGSGTANIELNGNSTLTGGTNHAGIEDNLGGTLTIKDDTGNNGTLTANGGEGGAGIGGGFGGSASNITISGGTVNATGGLDGAGIGSGQGNVDSSIITISGGTVRAVGGTAAAGIGGGGNGSVSNVTISGNANVSVAGGGPDSDHSAGAAIGSGGNIGAIDVAPDTSGLYSTGGVYYFEAGTTINNMTPGNDIQDLRIIGTNVPPSQAAVQQEQQTGEAVRPSYSAASSPINAEAMMVSQLEDDAAFLMAVEKQIDQLLDRILALIAEGKVEEAQALIGNGFTINAGTHLCFNKRILAKLGELSRTGIAITIYFIYEGVEYSVTIPANSEIDPNSLIDQKGFCGPMNLLTVFG